MKVQGSCHCGQIAYEAEVDPDRVHSSADSDDPPAYSLRVGCLDKRAQLEPKRRLWFKSALAWAQNVSAVPAKDTQ